MLLTMKGCSKVEKTVLEPYIKKIKNKLDKMMERIEPSEPVEPRSATVDGVYTDKFETFLRPNWTFSFFLGNIILLYRYTNDEKYLNYLKRAKRIYYMYLYESDAEIGHDTGFLFSLYAVNMYKITGEKEYRNLALKAADEVAKRFRLQPKHIQAFEDLRKRGINDKVSLMIADDMMNMHILMWAYAETGHSFYREVYECHINTAIRFLIRDDFSTRHAYHFDAVTGEPIGEMNYCGYGIGSHWTRGTGWILYGLISAWRFTKNEKLYRFSFEGVANKYFNELRDCSIPPWDFRDNSTGANKDTSAAAIIASASIEAEKMNIDEKLKDSLVSLKEGVLCRLLKDKFLNDENCECFIDYGNGEGCLWGDYFFFELVMKEYQKNNFSDMWL